jgi:vacuolar iron transporter family protein
MNGRAEIHHPHRDVAGDRPRSSAPGAMDGLVSTFALTANAEATPGDVTDAAAL